MKNRRKGKRRWGHPLEQSLSNRETFQCFICGCYYAKQLIYIVLSPLLPPAPPQMGILVIPT